MLFRSPNTSGLGLASAPHRAPLGRGQLRFLGLLHFNAALTAVRSPGSFGWDDAVSTVPAAAVPSYSGPSGYPLMSRYNNYAGAGKGDGQNRIAILDPNVS